MIENIFAFESSRIRQRAAPLLNERERFLAHLYSQHVSLPRLRSMASMLIHIARLMNLVNMRAVEVAEVKEAALRWISDSLPLKRIGRGTKSIETFTSLAMRWFRFNDLISRPVAAKSKNDFIIDEFDYYLREIRGLSAETIRSYRRRSASFLAWVAIKHESLAAVSLRDVDDYLEVCRNAGSRPRTIASICAALRGLFRYAELRHLNQEKIAPSIHSPRIERYDTKPKGPKWKDVRRLLNHEFGTTPSELRAAALLALCSIYALRRSEVVRLTLEDFDWVAETFTLRRSKNGRIQRFPIQFEVGEAILRYLQNGRPRCSCRQLFVTLNPPFRPVGAISTWAIVSRQMKLLGIQSENKGVHALRHSCATELLRKGSSLADIADFLGHKNMTSVSIYAKYDLRTLKQVASISLAGVK
jgi:site-specific recombinase XerD